MPSSNKRNYTQKQFEKDLSELERMIRNEQRGGKKNSSRRNNENEENQEGGKKKNSSRRNENNNNMEGGKKKNSSRGNENNNNMSGGKAMHSEEGQRHFKLVEVNGKKVTYEAGSHIWEHQSPLSAAKKLLKSIAHQQGLRGNNKVKLGTVHFVMQETTRGRKTHGKMSHYTGKYRKYTPEEMKKAKVSGRPFSMKPEVHKTKHHKHHVMNAKHMGGAKTKKTAMKKKSVMKKKSAMKKKSVMKKSVKKSQKGGAKL